VWQLVDAELCTQAFGDQVVVYNDRSGDTHLIGPAQSQVLDRLRRGPASVAEIAQSLYQSLGLTPDDVPETEIERMLAALHALVLIEPAAE
jgi:PqqD family protein of HPr-rel-A system